jgi:hypothetical protein
MHWRSCSRLRRGLRWRRGSRRDDVAGWHALPRRWQRRLLLRLMELATAVGSRNPARTDGASCWLVGRGRRCRSARRGLCAAPEPGPGLISGPRCAGVPWNVKQTARRVDGGRAQHLGLALAWTGIARWLPAAALGRARPSPLTVLLPRIRSVLVLACRWPASRRFRGRPGSPGRFGPADPGEREDQQGHQADRETRDAQGYAQAGHTACGMPPEQARGRADEHQNRAQHDHHRTRDRQGDD